MKKVTLNNYEALRSTIGLFDHEVSVIWINDGVFFTVKSTTDDKTEVFLRLAKDMEIKLYVNLDDIISRGYDENSLKNDIKPINSHYFNDIIKDSDVVITF